MAVTKSKVQRRKFVSSSPYSKQQKLCDQNYHHTKYRDGGTLPLNKRMFVSSLSKEIDSNNQSCPLEDSKRQCLSTLSKNAKDMHARSRLNDALDSRGIKVAALHLYNEILYKVRLEAKKDSGRQIHSRVAYKRLLKQEKRVSIDKKLGPICGVEIGDKFQSMVELNVVGLHHQCVSGIDFVKENGRSFATSVVASGRYDNEITSFELNYCGQGGNKATGRVKQPLDQRLERGNRAMINSMETRVPVRVIYGVKIEKSSTHVGLSGETLNDRMYVYAGLYHVDKFWRERGQFGKLVFRFLLKRIDGQPKLALFGMDRGMSKVKRCTILMTDISEGKEKLPIRCVNEVDEEKFKPFEYIKGNIYHESICGLSPLGCDNISGCGPDKNCACLVRNGESMPYNSKGCIISRKRLVYECSPRSNCPSSCSSRVSQNGITFQLEVFRSKSLRWGVRSRSFIPSGSFVCEYVGEVLRDNDVKRRIEKGYNKTTTCCSHFCQEGDMHILSYSQQGSPSNFTVDATTHGNVGRFINHSDVPNLRTQYVLYDHLDVKMPHIMLFATKNIAPLQELTVDYSCTISKYGM